MADAIDWELEFASVPRTPIKSGAYTLGVDDQLRVLAFSRAAGSVLTVPLDSQVALPIGMALGIDRRGGNVTIAGANGVTVTALSMVGAADRYRQGQSAILRKIGPNAWSLFGDLTLT